MGDPGDNQAIQLQPALAVWENEGGAPAHTDGSAATYEGAELDVISRSPPLP